MTDTFHLHNRNAGSSSSSSVTIPALEESALDRKNQLEKILLELKRMETHLHSITDEKILDGDLED